MKIFILLIFVLFLVNLSGCAGGGGGKTIDPELLREIVLEDAWKGLKFISFFLFPAACIYLYRLLSFIRSCWKSRQDSKHFIVKDWVEQQQVNSTFNEEF